MVEQAKVSRRPFAEEPARLHVGVYAFRAEALRRAVAAPRVGRCLDEDLEQLAWLDAGLVIGVRGIADAPLAIDTPDQLAQLRSRVHQGLIAVPAHPGPAVYAGGAPR